MTPIAECLVISFQRDHAIRLPRLQIQQRLDDAATVRTAIDIIAEKHESRRTPIGMSLAERHQIAQFLQRAVNIPDRIDKPRLADIGSGLRRYDGISDGAHSVSLSLGLKPMLQKLCGTDNSANGPNHCEGGQGTVEMPAKNGTLLKMRQHRTRQSSVVAVQAE